MIKLEELRKKLICSMYNLQKLGEELEIDPQVLYRFKNTQSGLSYRHFAKLAEFFDKEGK